MPKLTYDVTVSRDGSLWMLDIAPIGATGEARWLGEAEDVARAIIAEFDGVEPEKVDLELNVEFPGDAGRQLEKAEEFHQKAEDALDDEWAAQAAAARALDAAEVTRRDIGDILGVPVQRVRRLLKNSPRDRSITTGSDVD